MPRNIYVWRRVSQTEKYGQHCPKLCCVMSAVQKSRFAYVRWELLYLQVQEMKCLATLLQLVSVVATGMTCCIIHQNIQCGLQCDGRFLEEVHHKSCVYRGSCSVSGRLCVEISGQRSAALTTLFSSPSSDTRVGTLIVAAIYLQLIQNRYMFRSFTVLQCSHQHCVQPVASDVKVVGYLQQRLLC